MSPDGSGRGKGGYEIAIRPENHLRQAFLIAFVGVTWVGATVSFVRDSFIRPHHRVPAPLYVLLFLWLASVALMILSLVWSLFGAIVIAIQHGELRVAHKIGRQTIGRPKVYAVAYIQDMKAEERRYGLKGNPVVKYTITFEYLGGRRSLLSHYLSGRRAQALINGPFREFVRHQA